MSASQLADAAIANIPTSVQEKARYALEPRLLLRLKHVLDLLDREVALDRRGDLP